MLREDHEEEARIKGMVNRVSTHLVGANNHDVIMVCSLVIATAIEQSIDPSQWMLAQSDVSRIIAVSLCPPDEGDDHGTEH